MTRRSYGSGVGRSNETEDCIVASMLDDEGRPPCAAPDDCEICCLMSHQRPDESRSEWVGWISARANDLAYRRMWEGLNDDR